MKWMQQRSCHPDDFLKRHGTRLVTSSAALIPPHLSFRPQSAAFCHHKRKRTRSPLLTPWSLAALVLVTLVHPRVAAAEKDGAAPTTETLQAALAEAGQACGDLDFPRCFEVAAIVLVNPRAERAAAPRSAWRSGSWPEPEEPSAEEEAPQGDSSSSTQGEASWSGWVQAWSST